MGNGEEKAKAAGGRGLYRGCENCAKRVDGKCQITMEELTMVCKHWEAKGENRPGQLEHHTKSSEKISG